MRVWGLFLAVVAVCVSQSASTTNKTTCPRGDGPDCIYVPWRANLRRQ